MKKTSKNFCVFQISFIPLLKIKKMVVSDIIGSAGVVFMVTAFGLNMIDKLDDDDLLYILLNLLGSFLSCIASYMIDYTPFLILEGIWFMISLWGVYDYMKRNGIQFFKKI